MPKILSIDFDIIMYPCIKLYNDEVGGDMNSTQIWNWLEYTKEIEPFLNYDSKILINLAKLISCQIKKGAKLIPLKEHHHIIDDLKRQKDFDNTHIYDITNIDFHHDIFYRDEDVNLMTSFDKYNCSNWLGYLFFNNKSSHIRWFKAYNSGDNPEGIIDEVILITEIDTLLNENFDIIYFVESPQWVHYKYHHLYDLIIASAGYLL